MFTRIIIAVVVINILCSNTHDTKDRVSYNIFFPLQQYVRTITEYRSGKNIFVAKCKLSTAAIVRRASYLGMRACWRKKKSEKTQRASVPQPLIFVLYIYMYIRETQPLSGGKNGRGSGARTRWYTQFNPCDHLESRPTCGGGGGRVSHVVWKTGRQDFRTLSPLLFRSLSTTSHAIPVKPSSSLVHILYIR